MCSTCGHGDTPRQAGSALELGFAGAWTTWLNSWAGRQRAPPPLTHPSTGGVTRKRSMRWQVRTKSGRPVSQRSAQKTSFGPARSGPVLPW
jgi:hypothetical protein